MSYSETTVLSICDVVDYGGNGRGLVHVLLSVTTLSAKNIHGTNFFRGGLCDEIAPYHSIFTESPNVRTSCRPKWTSFVYSLRWSCLVCKSNFASEKRFLAIRPCLHYEFFTLLSTYSFFVVLLAVWCHIRSIRYNEEVQYQPYLWSIVRKTAFLLRFGWESAAL